MLTDRPLRSETDPPYRERRGDRFRHLFQAEPAAVRDALRRAVARFARQITIEDAGTLELTLAEALNNVVEHGYARLEPGPVDLRIVKSDEALECRIVDAGVPMPGLTLPDIPMQEIPDEIEALPEGGWGWALIRELTTNLAYQRENERNILTFHVPVSHRRGTDKT
ncbi:MAG: ATP-binding protein [Albidovulum sp.]|uniref:ATP-binding protein n=1 Tax=Albidovulum sp. TaxID=1872424 RepID=UPI003C7F02E2